MVYNSAASLQKAIESKCNKAVEITCNRLLGELQQLIDSEYYGKFDPEMYKRSYQFYESAMIKMLSTTCGEILMNPSAIHYDRNWDGLTQISAANEGVHGGYTTAESLSGHYWDSFIEYCSANAIPILKEELRAQGLPIV